MDAAVQGYHCRTNDLGGEDNISAAERSLIRRVAVITTELEMMEARFAAAGHADPSELDLYQRTAGNLRRLLEAVGLQRRAKPVPDLDTFLEMRKRANAPVRDDTREVQ